MKSTLEMSIDTRELVRRLLAAESAIRDLQRALRELEGVPVGYETAVVDMSGYERRSA